MGAGVDVCIGEDLRLVSRERAARPSRLRAGFGPTVPCPGQVFVLDSPRPASGALGWCSGRHRPSCHSGGAGLKLSLLSSVVVDGPYDAPVSKVGQVTVPQPVRDALGLGPGARAHFVLPDFLEGVALLVPQPVMLRWLSDGIEVAMAKIGMEHTLGASPGPEPTSAPANEQDAP